MIFERRSAWDRSVGSLVKRRNSHDYFYFSQKYQLPILNHRYVVYVSAHRLGSMKEFGCSFNGASTASDDFYWKVNRVTRTALFLFHPFDIILQWCH